MQSLASYYTVCLALIVLYENVSEWSAIVILHTSIRLARYISYSSTATQYYDNDKAGIML